MEYSLAHLTALDLPPPRLVEVAAAAGYDYVSPRLFPVTEVERPYRLDRDPAMLRQTRAALAEAGLKVLDVELCRLFADTDVDSFRAGLEVAAELGARHVIAGALDGDIDRLADHFGQLCDLAAPLNLTVDLEPVTFFPIPDVIRGGKVVTRANRPNGGLLVDTLHFWRSRCSLAALAALPRRWFHFAQLSDAPAKPPRTTGGLISTARNARNYLGEGGLDVLGVVECLPPVPYSLENPNSARVTALGAEEHARRTLLAAKSYLRDAVVVA